jgi:putative addiction module CopG family antidote
MTSTLPPELERFINDQVAQGNYPSAEDAVRVGVELLREQHLIDQYSADELRRELLICIEQADRGQVGAFDPIQRLAELRKDVDVGLDQMRRGRVTAADSMALLDEVEREGS